MIDIKYNQVRMCRWEGYSGARQDEPIGIGRLVSKRILDKMNWTPFDPDKNNSMDFMMYKKCLELGGKVKMVKDDTLIPLSISCDAWSNMHKFEDHWEDRVPSRSVRLDGTEIAEQHFPEHKQFYADLYQ
jgi:hypothetical protein